MSAQQRADNQPSVHRAGNRLAHAPIAQNRVAQVEAEILQRRAASVLHHKVWPPGQQRQRIHGQGIHRNIRRALLQFQRLGDRVRHNREAHPLNRGRMLPVVRVAFQNHVLIGLRAHKFERPCADRMPPEILPAAVGNNAHRACGEIGQQKIIRLAQMKDDRERVARLNALHRRIRCGLGRNHGAVTHRLHRPHHIACRQRLSIVEEHATAQMKNHRARVRFLPPFGQRRREVEVRIARHQPIENQLVDVLRLPIGANAWVKIRRARVDKKDQRFRIAFPAAATRQQ